MEGSSNHPVQATVENLSSETCKSDFLRTVLVFQVQIFGSFKTGLYLPTRLVILLYKFHTGERISCGICSPVEIYPISQYLLLVHTCPHTSFNKKGLCY